MIPSNSPTQDGYSSGLRRSEARFRTVFEQSPVSTQIFSPDGKTLEVNHAWEQLWGVTLDQIRGYNILQDQQLVEQGVMPYIQRGFAGQSTEIPPIRYEPERTIAGISTVPYRWVSASIYPVRDENGQICEVVLMHQDITAGKLAEDALQRSEERFHAIFDRAPVGIALLDGEGRYVAVNPVRQEMLGYTEVELIGKRYIDFTFPEDMEYDQRINDEARARGENHYQLEKRFVRKDGSIAWTRITVAVIRDEKGDVLYSISIAEDTTERKRAEEALALLYDRESAARERVERLAAEQAAILGQITDGIMIADPQGTITFVNDAAARIHGQVWLGIPVHSYAEKYSLMTLEGKAYRSEFLPLARAVLYGETVVDARWRIRRPDGTEVIAQGSATPVVSENGARLGAVLTVRDVTEQVDLELQKDDFLSAAAHDLRTPLTSIRGRVQLLQRRLAAGTVQAEKLAEDLKRVESGTTRMVTLLNELLDVANIQIGRPVVLARRPTDLVEMVQGAVREHQQAESPHQLLVRASVPELVGQWDVTRLERVLGNLISNAIKYSPEGGEVVVGIDRVEDAAGTWAVITVTDQGIGIPESDLPHIFDRFHRAGNVMGRIPGTGIGLAAVLAIVEQHGGQVSVRSQEGKGTTFTVRLPVNAPQEGTT